MPVLKKLLLSLMFALCANTAAAMFIQPDWLDPTEPGGGTNRYAYSGNDPINKLAPGGNKSRLAQLFESVGDWLRRDSAATGVRGINSVATARKTAVDDAWKMEQQLVRGEGRGTRIWDVDELKLLLDGKKVPGYRGHHMTSVSADLTKAADHKNIQFLTKEKHDAIQRQNGGFRVPITSDRVIDRTDKGKYPDLATAGARSWPRRAGEAMVAISNSHTMRVFDLADPTAVAEQYYLRTYGYSIWDALSGNKPCRGPLCTGVVQMNDIYDLLSLNRWGDLSAKQGGFIAGHQPDIAPSAYDVSINKPLKSELIPELIRFSEPVPKDLVLALFGLCNGAVIARTELIVFGVLDATGGGDDVHIPMDINVPNIYERPSGLGKEPLILANSSEVDEASGAKVKMFHYADKTGKISVSSVECILKPVRTYGDVKMWLCSEFEIAVSGLVPK